MDVLDEHDDLADDCDVTTHRDRAKGMLNKIAQETKQALAERAIDIPLFFFVPSSGPIVTFGTLLDPDDTTWGRVEQIVAAIIQASIGIARVRCLGMHCATTDDADHQPRTVQPSEPLDNRPASTIPAAVQHWEADHGITDDVSNRLDLPPSHPILLRLRIDPAHWYDFERLQSDNPAVRILGHDEPAAGWMIVHLACASCETRDRLEDGWS